MDQKSSTSASESFTNTLLRLQNSATYALFCENVYGRNLRQFNAVDEEQLQTLLSSLDLSDNHSVLDLGCGGGFISEYISDLTGAKVTGIDFADKIIRSAQNRTLEKKERLKFQTADLNAIPHEIGKFDFILSIDTLYFIEDLSDAIKKLKNFLLPDGKFVAFYTYKRKEGDIGNELNPGSNNLGKALKNAGFEFQTRDFSSNEKEVWEKARHFSEVLKDSFIEEGYRETYEGRIWESEHNLKSIYENRSARSFYVAE